ncbi:hypothetical protein PV04_02038 [Phialophora macrospora]|uniref:Uncharacterized protein n=1 Tax=Phialophora macrospora TaxID=1851006 RepID=A0A0D2GNK4_9EURO|nr:hypothetical protein PV04_02038 [Phialophora macrospora]
MDKELFISLKQDGTRTVAEDSATAKVDSTAPHVTMMPSKEGLSCSLNELRQPRRRGRRVTIGGSDRRTNDDHSSLQTDRHAPDSVPLGASPIITKHHTSEPSTQLGFISRQQIPPRPHPVRRPYPPTSWKSTSTLESITLDASGSSTSDATARTDPCGRPADRHFVRQDDNADGATESLVDTVTAAVPSPQSEIRLTLDKPVRTPSRRHYTIVSSHRTGAASVTSLEASRDKAPPVTDQVVTGKAALPDPEAAYSQGFHYTACPHISPPKSRPLNVQPALVKYHQSLLLRPPPDLQEIRFDPGTAPPDIYTLDGACFDCDLSVRRQTESGILETYTHRLENLTIQMSLLQHDIVAEHSALSPTGDSGAFTAFTLPSTLNLSPDATQGILEIEEQLSQLINKRDEDIKLVWRGFTARWGPGTVLIRRNENDGTLSRAQSRSTTRTSSSTNSFRVASADMTSTTSIGANTTVSPSRQGSFATRTRASSVQGRYSDGTYDVSVGSSLDPVKERGRMMIDWIRPGPSEDTLGGGNQTGSRKSSRQGRRIDNGA